MPDRERCDRSEEHTSELQSLAYLVCRLLLEKTKERRDSRPCRARSPRRGAWGSAGATSPHRLGASTPAAAPRPRRRIRTAIAFFFFLNPAPPGGQPPPTQPTPRA